MTKEVLDFQVNNGICEAVGCFARATTKIKVKVGQLGSISLDLCNDCIGKFNENDNRGCFGKADLKQKIARNQEEKRTYMEAIER